MGKKPSLYLDTTVISSFWYKGNDVLALARRILTRDWCPHDRLSVNLELRPLGEPIVAAES
jgi:hypothetical protein